MTFKRIRIRDKRDYALDEIGHPSTARKPAPGKPTVEQHIARLAREAEILKRHGLNPDKCLKKEANKVLKGE